MAPFITWATSTLWNTWCKYRNLVIVFIFVKARWGVELHESVGDLAEVICYWRVYSLRTRMNCPAEPATYALVACLFSTGFFFGALMGPILGGVLFDTVGYRLASLVVLLIVIIPVRQACSQTRIRRLEALQRYWSRMRPSNWSGSNEWTDWVYSRCSLCILWCYEIIFETFYTVLRM